MINDSLNVVESTLASTAQELSILDARIQDVATHQEITSALKSDVETLRTNAAGLDAKVRGGRFTATNSALSLAQSDLETAQDALSAQKAKVVAIGKAAARALCDVRDALETQRQQNVETWLSAQFDWTTIPSIVTPSNLAAVHETVQAIRKLSVSNLPYELDHDDDTSVKALRRLGEHCAELRPLVESEPGLSLNISAVKVLPIAKANPVVAGNQLGTLAA